MHEAVHTIPVRIAFVGGGSLNWALGLMADLAFDTRLAAEVRLYDIDHAAASRNAAIGARFAKVSRGTPASYRMCPTLPEALNGADIVVISILPGQFEDMESDIGLPAEFGIPQAVGDTVGPGGFFRALRAIPMVADIAHAIRDHAPNAYVCNLTNPMSVLTDTLCRTLPGGRVWGECHEVTKIRRQVAEIACREVEAPIWTHRDVEVNVLGINHFTFVDRIALDGRDMMPSYRAFVAAHETPGYAQTEPGKDAEHATYFGSKCRVGFDMFRRFGLPGAAGDRHLAEFFPVDAYLADPEEWGFALTPVSYRIRDREQKLQRANALAAGDIAPKAKRSDEALIDQISALMIGGSFVSNVNLPNHGQLDGFPRDAVVETNAVFSGLGISPMLAGRLPQALEYIAIGHARTQSSLVTAVLENDRDALFPLFQSDPLVAHLSNVAARSLFDRMLAATSDWIPDQLTGTA